jgi:hypothetical protein
LVLDWGFICGGLDFRDGGEGGGEGGEGGGMRK